MTPTLAYAMLTGAIGLLSYVALKAMFVGQWTAEVRGDITNLRSDLTAQQRRWSEHYRNYGAFIGRVNEETSKFEGYHTKHSEEIAVLNATVLFQGEEIRRLRDRH